VFSLGLFDAKIAPRNVRGYKCVIENSTQLIVMFNINSYKISKSPHLFKMYNLYGRESLLWIFISVGASVLKLLPL
jgi:hypothetical protein